MRRRLALGLLLGAVALGGCGPRLATPAVETAPGVQPTAGSTAPPSAPMLPTTPLRRLSPPCRPPPRHRPQPRASLAYGESAQRRATQSVEVRDEGAPRVYGISPAAADDPAHSAEQQARNATAEFLALMSGRRHQEASSHGHQEAARYRGKGQ